jgi:hypothetical protein
VEVVVSMAVTTILMGAVASAMVLASRALPSDADSLERSAEVMEVVDQFAGELLYATSFTENTGSAITFTVADRGHKDAGPEAIRYAWSGTAGDPLLRQYNGGSEVAVLDDIQAFELVYDGATVAEESPGDPIESDREQLASYVTGPSLTEDIVAANKWWGEYFKPSLPPETVSWSIEDVYVRARQTGAADGQTRVQLRPASADSTPTSTVYEQVSVAESTLPLPGSPFTWQPMGFSSVVDLSPDEGICLVLITDDPSGSWELEYHGGSVELPDAGLLQSSGGEGGWTISKDKALRFMVYGTYTTLGAPSVKERLYVAGVGIKLEAGSDPSVRVEAGTHLLNAPQAVGP